MPTAARVLALIGILVVTFGSGAALIGGCSRASSTSDDTGIAWVYDLDRGLKMAAEQGKPVMVDFYTHWCTWCTMLDEHTYSDARVRDRASRFVAVKIDAERDEASPRKYGVEGFPTIVFLNAQGKEIHRVPGFAPPEAFLDEMDKALRKAK